MKNTTENTNTTEATKLTCDCGNAPLSNETPGTGLHEENGVVTYQCGCCWAAYNYGGVTAPQA